MDVEIEKLTTWPPDFAGDATQNRSLILDYHRKQSEINELCEEDVMARINPPENEYEEEYEGLAERLDKALAPHRIVAYHCTRLTPQEIDEIVTGGLRVLSSDLLTHRLGRCLAQGHLRKQDYDYLTGSEMVKANLKGRNGRRAGMIWFCPDRSTLRECNSVYRLFRSWGGEAVYNGHEKDENIAHVLADIGTPCIVKCAIPFSRAQQFHQSFAERFVSAFVSDEIEYAEPSADFDLYTTQDVPSSDVLQVIQFSDPVFQSLTDHARWPQRYRITAQLPEAS